MSTKTSAVRVKKILVPTDFSEISLAALDYAARIAKRDDGEILLLHVIESYMENSIIDMRVDYTEIIEKGIENKFNEIKLKNKNLEGVTIRSKVVLGKIHAEIDQIAAQENIRLIIMGTHGVSGRTNIGKFILGSNAYRTIGNAPCPIITLREAPRRKEIKNIVVPLDSTKASTEKLDVAIRWAKFFDAKIHLLAVTAFFEEYIVDVKTVTEKVHAAEKRLVKAGVEYHAKIVRHKAPSEAVMEYAIKSNADLIFIVTGQESQLSEMLFGSSARNIISDSTIPVMSINIKKYQG
ncbi:MAG: universal stress protein [Chitinophagales bacterium]|nr:universal stress protein [Chitinophagales bacterium]